MPRVHIGLSSQPWAGAVLVACDCWGPWHAMDIRITVNLFIGEGHSGSSQFGAIVNERSCKSWGYPSSAEVLALALLPCLSSLRRGWERRWGQESVFFFSLHFPLCFPVS